MAADRNPDVMELVQERLQDDHDYSTKELKTAAEEIDEDIEELSLRQFNARYPLQVRRQVATDGAEEAETEDATTDEGSLRPAVRQALLDFARDVTGAEDWARVVDVVTSVDEYVDRVMAET